MLPILGADAEAFAADTVVTLDNDSLTFPFVKLNDLPAGEYAVQAIFATNRDINLPNAPGNRYCDPVTVKLDPAAGTVVDLTLNKSYAERTPKETKTAKFLKLPSKLLSDFHGRPMEYRVGVVLPPNFDKEPDKKYGLIVDIGGFGTRYTAAARLAPDPRFVQIVPDGAGPFGDPYQVDSANNGPYGEALTKEVIPYIEKTYRCLGTPKSRFTTGGSTGGWVSLALQVFYPDFFNGCWSQCPDSVTFERFELIDIYDEPNAYVNRFGFERPSTRTIDGDTVSTVRHECQLERVLGRGGRWELERPRLGELERDLRPEGEGRPAGAAVGRQDRGDRQDRRRALEEVRPEAGAGEELEDTRAEARGREGQHLGRRLGRLLPERRGAPAQGLDGPAARIRSSTARS